MTMESSGCDLDQEHIVSRVIKVFGVKLHPAAGCEDCVWSHGPSAVTRDAAKNHTKGTGHKTVVETIERDVYGVEGAP